MKGAKRRYEELGVDVDNPGKACAKRAGEHPLLAGGMMSQDLRTAVKRFPEESRLPEIISERGPHF